MTLTKGLLVAIGAALVSFTARAQFSEAEVKRQDRVEWLDRKRHVPIVEDQRVQKYAQCIFTRVLAELSEEESKKYGGLEWEVLVFDSDTPNAEADSNGKISVYSALLDVADTQDALAAVIGHEI